MQKFIAGSSKTIQLNPFDYRAANNPPASSMADSIDWDKAFEQDSSAALMKPVEPAINLNATDFDFLEMMGM